MEIISPARLDGESTAATTGLQISFRHTLLSTRTPTRSDLDQAIALANDFEYGLSGSIFTTNLRTAHRFIEGADVGQVSVSLATAGWDVHLNFGGLLGLGSPLKEQSVEALSFNN